MSRADFVVLQRGADELRYFRFRGDEARDLWRMLESGHLDRPEGRHKVDALLEGRSPDVTDPASAAVREADFDFIADAELRQWMSRRYLQRRARAENAAPTPDEG